MSSSSSDSSVSWEFSDRGIGSSVGSDSTTVYSSPDSFEKEVCDLQHFRERLLEEDIKLEKILKDIQTGSNRFDLARLNSEKKILATHLKTKLLLEDFRKRCSSFRGTFYNIGSVSLTNVKLHYSNSRNYRQYFLCALTCNSTLCMSRICEPNSDGIIDFNIYHTFTNLPVDFEISVKIYVLTVKKKNCVQKLKDKITSWFTPNSSQNENTWRRESLFKLWKTVSITMSNVNQTHEVILELIDSQLCKLVTDVIALVNTSDFCHKGWLDVSRNGLFWNQKWCVLQGTELKCFNYPVDDLFNLPFQTINLNACRSVRITRGTLQSRRRTLVLEMEENSNNPLSFYLSTCSYYEFKQWKVLSRLVDTIRIWKETQSSIV